MASFFSFPVLARHEVASLLGPQPPRSPNQPTFPVGWWGWSGFLEGEGSSGLRDIRNSFPPMGEVGKETNPPHFADRYRENLSSHCLLEGLILQDP